MSKYDPVIEDLRKKGKKQELNDVRVDPSKGIFHLSTKLPLQQGDLVKMQIHNHVDEIRDYDWAQNMDEADVDGLIDLISSGNSVNCLTHTLVGWNYKRLVLPQPQRAILLDQKKKYYCCTLG